MTEIYLIAITLAVIGWDIYLALDKTPGNTVSQVIQRYDKKYPIIRFSFGVLCGHWFWPV